MLLKKREVSLFECEQLYRIMKEKKVYPYVRERSQTLTGYIFNTKKLLERESKGELFTRTIISEFGRPIGCISLFDVKKNEGFLATWLGADYHGKGYNKIAKELFFDFIFFQEGIENVFLKIKKDNKRSINATKKLKYAVLANNIRNDIYQQINEAQEKFDLYYVTKLNYLIYKQQKEQNKEIEAIMA